MLTEICAEIKNYFCKEEDRIIGDFAISGGSITPAVSIADNQYYRIVGSIFNDGVHQYGDDSDILVDEGEFHGAIWLMRVPLDVIKLAEDIEAWNDANADMIHSPYQSESFGGYSYSMGANANGTVGTNWKNQADFMARLAPYRRIRVI